MSAWSIVHRKVSQVHLFADNQQLTRNIEAVHLRALIAQENVHMIDIATISDFAGLKPRYQDLAFEGLLPNSNLYLKGVQSASS